MRNRRAVIAAITLACVAAGPARAEPPTPRPAPQIDREYHELPRSLDLQTAIALARRYSLEVRLAEERIDEQRAVTSETRSRLGPSVGIDGDYGEIDDGLIEGFGDEFRPRTESWSLGLEARQPVFRAGRDRARTRAQQSRETAQDEAARGVRYDVMLAVATTFFDAMLAREQVEVQGENIRLFEEQRELARNRLAAGAGSQFEVLQADVAVRNARPPLVRAGNNYRIAIDDLRRVIGLPYPEGVGAADIELVGEWPFPKVDFPLEEAIRTAREYRPELLELALREEAAREDARADRADRWPKIDLAGGYEFRSRQFGDDLDDSLDGWKVLVTAEVPVFESGYYTARIKAADSRLRQAGLELERRAETVDLEVRRAFSLWEEAREILSTADAVIEQADEALRLANNRFRVGASTQLDVLQSQVELIRARLERAQASRDYNLAVARLNRAMGILYTPAPGS